jgi:hypothetical protein
MSLFNLGLEIGTDSFINPHSAFRIPTHLSNILFNFQATAPKPHNYAKKILSRRISPTLLLTDLCRILYMQNTTQLNHGR